MYIVVRMENLGSTDRRQEVYSVPVTFGMLILKTTGICYYMLTLKNLSLLSWI
jgi:hypothetical protein